LTPLNGRNQRPRVTLVAAVADNGVIGRNNALPWRLPDDLKRFKRLTLGKPVVMGRRTWASLGGPLGERDNIVLTRDRSFASSPAAAGACVAHSVEEMLGRCAQAPEIAVIGGAEIYRALLPLADRMELTRVHASIAGDTWFPAFDPEEWRVVASEPHPADARHTDAFTFETLERLRAPERA
jgi:dihydrofolate reductase